MRDCSHGLFDSWHNSESGAVGTRMGLPEWKGDREIVRASGKVRLLPGLNGRKGGLIYGKGDKDRFARLRERGCWARGDTSQ